MQDDKQKSTGEIAVNGRFLTWLDNFWYHHKWKVIVISFFLLVFVVCFAQCASRDLSDSYITFSGGRFLTEEESAAIEQIFSALTKNDQDPDGIDVGLITHPFYTENELRELYTEYYTEEELRALYPEATEEELASHANEIKTFDTAGFNRAKQANIDRFQNMETYLLTGESSLWLVSEEVYKNLRLKENEVAVPLSITFGEQIPYAAYDEYAVRLADTEIYRYYDALKLLPEDTLIVLTAKMVWGASSNDAQYQRVKALYRSILEFQAP